jgi:iron(III) transport system substrate-binding protein
MASGLSEPLWKARTFSRRRLLRSVAIGGSAAAGLALIGCGGGSGNQSPQKGSPATTSAATASNPAWDALVAAAKKEGKIVISGGPTPDTRKNVPAAFKDRFGIDMEYLAGASSDLAARLQSERAAGQFTIDACISGAQTMYGTFYANKWLQPMKPALILPEVLDGKNWRTGKVWFMDPNETTVLRLLSYSSHPLAINTKLLPAAQVKTADALLDPKLKGKIAAYDPTTNGSGLPSAAEYYLKKGEDFCTKLFKGQQVQISRDTQALADGLARDKYAALIGVGWAYLDPLVKDGFPIQDVSLSDVPDYISGGFGTVAIFDKAPHPNAAKLFANWIASKDGATVDSKAEVAVSNRTDIDYSWAPDEAKPKQGMEYFDTYGWDFTLNQVIPIRDKFVSILK